MVVVERAELRHLRRPLVLRVVASHFLWRLVRRLVGALVHVGGGELSVAAFAALLDGRLPRRA